MQLALFSFIIGKRPEKKSEKPIPTKETPGIVEKPKLKATGKAKVEESPMEKLKRLENGKRQQKQPCKKQSHVQLKVMKKPA